jgi:hypothetical protein
MCPFGVRPDVLHLLYLQVIPSPPLPTMQPCQLCVLLDRHVKIKNGVDFRPNIIYSQEIYRLILTGLWSRYTKLPTPTATPPSQYLNPRPLLRRKISICINNGKPVRHRIVTA